MEICNFTVYSIYYVYCRVLYADPGKVKLYLHKMEREGIERVKVLCVQFTVSYFHMVGKLETIYGTPSNIIENMPNNMMNMKSG